MKHDIIIKHMFASIGAILVGSVFYTIYGTHLVSQYSTSTIVITFVLIVFILYFLLTALFGKGTSEDQAKKHVQ